MEGLLAKASVIAWCYANDLEEMTDCVDWLFEGNSPSPETLSLSLAADLIKIVASNSGLRQIIGI